MNCRLALKVYVFRAVGTAFRVERIGAFPRNGGPLLSRSDGLEQTVIQPGQRPIIRVISTGTVDISRLLAFVSIGPVALRTKSDSCAAAFPCHAHRDRAKNVRRRHLRAWRYLHPIWLSL